MTQWNNLTFQIFIFFMLILRYKLNTATADDGGILTFFTLRICTLVVWKHYTFSKY